MMPQTGSTVCWRSAGQQNSGRDLGAGEGPRRHLHPGLLPLGLADLPACQFPLHGQSVLPRLGLRRLGPGEQLFDLPLDLLQLLAGAQHPTPGGQFEHLRKAAGEQPAMAAPERILLASRT
jgi:hypothetical protein